MDECKPLPDTPAASDSVQVSRSTACERDDCALQCVADVARRDFPASMMPAARASKMFRV